METLLPLLKRFAVALLKKAATGVKKAIRTGFHMITDNFQTDQHLSSPHKKKRKKGKPTMLIATCFTSVFIAVAGIVVSLCLIILIPVIVITGLIQSLFAPSLEISSIIDEYWAEHSMEYGTEEAVKRASGAEQMAFLLQYDDFWKESQQYFEFDRDTMLTICTSVRESSYYEIAQAETEIQIYDSGHTPLFTQTEGESAYDKKTPVYIDIGNHYLTWQELYGILAGCTDATSIKKETVQSLAESLSPKLSAEYEPAGGLYYSWTELENMESVTETFLPMNDGICRTYLGEEQQDKDDMFFWNGTSYNANLLCYTRKCPLISPTVSVTTWDGSISYEMDDAVKFTGTDAGILTAVENAGFTLDTRDAVSSIVYLPNGYIMARNMSAVISDGTVEVVSNDTFNQILSLFTGSEDLLNQLLSMFGIITNTEGNSDFSSYEDTGDYVIFESYMGGPDVIWWSQYWFSNDYYGTSTVADCGCGPSSLAIVYSSLTGDIQNPAVMAKWCYNHGYYYRYTSTNTTVGVAGIFDKGATELGLRVDYSGTGPSAFQEAIPYLDEGDLIVCLVGCNARGNPIFSGQGHFLVVRGYTPDGTILLADPGKTNVDSCASTTYEVKDMETILDRRSVNNVGRVWAIGYSNK